VASDVAPLFEPTLYQGADPHQRTVAVCLKTAEGSSHIAIAYGRSDSS